VLRAYRFFDGLRGEARPWLLAIVRNSCLSWLQVNRPVELAGFDDRTVEPIEENSPETLALRQCDRRMLNEALAALSAQFREALILRELEDLSYKDIARITDVPLGTVMSRLARGGGYWPNRCRPFPTLRRCTDDARGSRETAACLRRRRARCAKSLELEAHLAGNPAARAACERLREMSAAIRSRADYHAAPASLAARLRASVPAVLKKRRGAPLCGRG